MYLGSPMSSAASLLERLDDHLLALHNYLQHLDSQFRRSEGQVEDPDSAFWCPESRL